MKWIELDKNNTWKGIESKLENLPLLYKFNIPDGYSYIDDILKQLNVIDISRYDHAKYNIDKRDNKHTVSILLEYLNTVEIISIMFNGMELLTGKLTCTKYDHNFMLLHGIGHFDIYIYKDYIITKIIKENRWTIAQTLSHCTIGLFELFEGNVKDHLMLYIKSFDNNTINDKHIIKTWMNIQHTDILKVKQYVESLELIVTSISLIDNDLVYNIRCPYDKEDDVLHIFEESFRPVDTK